MNVIASVPKQTKNPFVWQYSIMDKAWNWNTYKHRLVF